MKTLVAAILKNDDTLKICRILLKCLVKWAIKCNDTFMFWTQQSIKAETFSSLVTLWDAGLPRQFGIVDHALQHIDVDGEWIEHM